MRKIVLLVSLVLVGAFARANDISFDGQVSYEELCKYDGFYCREVLTDDGQVKKPDAILLILMTGFQQRLRELGKEYNIPDVMPAAAIITEHSLNVGIEDKIQDSLADTTFTRHGKIFGLKGMSYGFGQLYSGAGWIAEKVVARHHDRKPSRDIMEKNLKTMDGALEYAAALMSFYADQYEAAGFHIRNNPGILATLYNLGDWQRNLQTTLKEHRQPKVNYFGWFVNTNWKTYEGLLSKDNLLSETSFNDQKSLQEVNQNYSGVDGKVRWLLNSLYTDPVYERVETKKPVRLFYQPFRCKDDYKLRDIFTRDGTKDEARKIKIAALMDKLSLKGRTSGIFQVMSINFDCTGSPWALLNFDNGMDGWISFSELIPNIQSVYQKASCKPKVQDACRAQVAELVRTDSSFGNFIGSSPSLGEDLTWGLEYLQLAPGLSRTAVKLMSSSDVHWNCMPKKQTTSYYDKPKPGEDLNAAWIRTNWVTDRSWQSNGSPPTSFQDYLAARFDGRPYQMIPLALDQKIQEAILGISNSPTILALSTVNQMDKSKAVKELIRSLRPGGWGSVNLSWVPKYMELCTSLVPCYVADPGIQSIQQDVDLIRETSGDLVAYERTVHDPDFKPLPGKNVDLVSRSEWDKDVAKFKASLPMRPDEQVNIIKAQCRHLSEVRPDMGEKVANFIKQTYGSVNDGTIKPLAVLSPDSVSAIASACIVIVNAWESRIAGHPLPLPSLYEIQNSGAFRTSFGDAEFDSFLYHHNLFVKFKLDGVKEEKWDSVDARYLSSLHLSESEFKSILDKVLDEEKKSFQQIESKLSEFARKYYPENYGGVPLATNETNENSQRCTYNPTKTYQRIEALSKLSCVKTVFIPEEDTLLPASISANLNVTVYPFKQKDRFAVEFKRTCK